MNEGSGTQSKLTDQELCGKAQTAALNYRRVYGVYPAKIGIEAERLKHMHIDALHFPDLQKEIPPFDLARPLDWLPPDFSVVRVEFHSVVGERVSPDEVYLLRPLDESKIASGAAIARLQHMKESRAAREEWKCVREMLPEQFKREYYGAF